MKPFGVMVVGAGGMASVAAYYLTLVGAKTLVLEQVFPRSHFREFPRGISCDSDAL